MLSGCVCVSARVCNTPTPMMALSSAMVTCLALSTACTTCCWCWDRQIRNMSERVPEAVAETGRDLFVKLRYLAEMITTLFQWYTHRLSKHLPTAASFKSHGSHNLKQGSQTTSLWIGKRRDTYEGSSHIWERTTLKEVKAPPTCECKELHCQLQGKYTNLGNYCVSRLSSSISENKSTKSETES